MYTQENFPMKKTLLLSCILGAVGFAFLGFNKNEKLEEIKIDEGFVFVQLFTSQGCSSCPPADKLLDKITEDNKDENIYTLSYHVDYWNRLGWKDPFSSKTFSDKQYEYSQQFGSSTVYTPQAVINGQIHFTGSSSDKMDKALKYYLKSDSPININITNITSSDTKITANFNSEELPKNAYLVVALVVDSRNTSVKRGENVGKIIKNNNIVATEKAASPGKKNGSLALEIPEWIELKDNLSLVAYIQNEDLKILGASKKKIER